MRRVTLWVALAILALFPGQLVAQEEHGGSHEAESEEHAAEGEHGGGHGEGHEFHKNSFALFLGSTQAEKEDGERDDPQFTIGFDYERRLTKAFGIGAVLDLVVEGHREGILAVAGVGHAGHAKFILAPGIERVRDSGHHEGVVRLGAMYSFPAGWLHIEPSVFYDVTEEGGTWVLGVTLGHEW